ncbi:hypothetical protein [Bacillus chungangensis]|uniref:Abortive phage infection protein n=1 Tax=Bacillus chungangensis TaxID=587633 RepID=A0ABT9WVM8_9BACI|nr:hypothetical protein [Bacillus chungangensis]MDQ0176942.1 hypothetical protein [Bacillus chungangensis]
MKEEEIIQFLDQLRRGERKELLVEKEDFLFFRKILVEQDDFKNFYGTAKRGGDTLYRYIENN